jgi:hypothetical protein
MRRRWNETEKDRKSYKDARTEGKNEKTKESRNISNKRGLRRRKRCS